MKKLILPIIILSLLFGTISPIGIPSVSYGVNFAQEVELPNPGLTPDSPFYFLDTLGEKINLFFTFDPAKKAEKAFQYVGEKLAEIKGMAEANKIEALKKAGQKYQEYLALFFKKGEEAYGAGRDLTELEKKAKLKSLDYLVILSDTYERISEEKARTEIDNLRKVSRKLFGETIWSMHEERMRELREERMKEKIQKQIEILEKEGIKTEAKKNVVAIVNGVEITENDFFQKLRAYIQSNKSQMRTGGIEQGADETEDEFVQRVIPLIMPPIGKGVLEYMITEIIIEQKAKEQNIAVKPGEIDKKIDELKVTAQKLSESGMTIEELRRQVESQILMEKIVAKGVIVTEEEIRHYFVNYKANFAKPEEIRASHILLRTEEEAKEVLSQLKAGADFAELARKESTDSVTKDKGGDLGFFSLGRMTPTFEQAAFALKAGELSEVVKTPYGYHIIKVTEKKPAQEANLELVREEIRKTLTEQKTWTARSNLLQNLKKEAKIEIWLPELRD